RPRAKRKRAIRARPRDDALGLENRGPRRDRRRDHAPSSDKSRQGQRLSFVDRGAKAPFRFLENSPPAAKVRRMYRPMPLKSIGRGGKKARFCGPWRASMQSGTGSVPARGGQAGGSRRGRSTSQKETL